jgi:hypothetical protein
MWVGCRRERRLGLNGVLFDDAAIAIQVLAGVGLQQRATGQVNIDRTSK